MLCQVIQVPVAGAALEDAPRSLMPPLVRVLLPLLPLLPLPLWRVSAQYRLYPDCAATTVTGGSVDAPQSGVLTIRRTCTPLLHHIFPAGAHKGRGVGGQLREKCGETRSLPGGGPPVAGSAGGSSGAPPHPPVVAEDAIPCFNFRPRPPCAPAPIPYEQRHSVEIVEISGATPSSTTHSDRSMSGRRSHNSGRSHRAQMRRARACRMTFIRSM